MPIRANTLWRVPVFCMASGWISYYFTIYFGASFYSVQTELANGAIQLSTDPIRTLIWHGTVFAAILLLGSRWCFRDMTGKELALSAAIASGIYLLLVLAQLLIPGFPLALSMQLAKIQNWDVFVSSVLMNFTSQVYHSTILSCFSPFLFLLFRKRKTNG